MSQASLSHGHGHDHAAHGHVEPQIAARALLKPELVNCESGMFRMLGYGLMLAGVLGLVLTGVIGFGSKEASRQAVAAYHMGFLFCVGLSVGCLGFQMILQQFNAGWSAALRRQAENVAAMVWVCALLFIPIALNAFLVNDEYKLFSWMSLEHTAGDVLFQKKAAWLNPEFWAIRSAVYFLVWIALSQRLARLSRKQDETGDRWLTAKARRTSSYGLLLFALTTAFASFDWLMSLDYHWFSTMFGVYFFAGSIVSAVAVIILILGLAVGAGKLTGLVTSEHFHDAGKLLFAFIVFWAYVTFSQYFLIWYSNIPEESAFYNLRQIGAWRQVSIFLAFGHFIIPFLFVLFRGTKRNRRLLMLAALWMLAMHALDLFYIVRPVLKSVPLGERLHLDVLGLLGPVCLFLGLVLRKVVSAPLMPLKDPRLHEALEHKNYV